MIKLSPPVTLKIVEVHEYVVVQAVYIQTGPPEVVDPNNIGTFRNDESVGYHMQVPVNIPGYPAFMITSYNGTLIETFRIEDLGLSSTEQINAYAKARAIKYFSYKLN